MHRPFMVRFRQLSEVVYGSHLYWEQEQLGDVNQAMIAA
jgi:hypothetical protein